MKRFFLRLYFDNAMVGPGKAELLEHIRETGSISAAGRAMGMSYKRAWMLVEEQGTPLPAADDLLALARIWRQIFHPQGRLRDFTHAWHTCIDQKLPQAS